MIDNISLAPQKLTELLGMDPPNQPQLIINLREQVIKAFGNSKEMRKIVDRQCEYREQTHCYLCDSEANCLILNGIAYLDLGEVEVAIKELENANQHHLHKDESWQLIIGLALIGNAYEKSRKNHQAFREYEKAHELIIKYLRVREKDYVEESISLEKKLQEKLDELNS